MVDEFFDELLEHDNETVSFECPLCGVEVEESGMCESCREDVEDDEI